MYHENLDLRDIVYTNDEGIECVEQWKDVVGYEGLYMVSDLGRVKSVYRKVYHPNKKNGQTIHAKIRRKTKSKGYLKLGLLKNGIYGYFTVHRLVAMAFIPNPENKPEVNHKDGNKLNNKASNLEWNTSKENTKHAHDNGMCKKRNGEKCNFTKLSKEDVLKIRELALTQSRKSIRELYGMSETGIEQIINRKTWKHI